MPHLPAFDPFLPGYTSSEDDDRAVFRPEISISMPSNQWTPGVQLPVLLYRPMTCDFVISRSFAWPTETQFIFSTFGESVTCWAVVTSLPRGSKYARYKGVAKRLAHTRQLGVRGSEPPRWHVIAPYTIGARSTYIDTIDYTKLYMHPHSHLCIRYWAQVTGRYEVRT